MLNLSIERLIFVLPAIIVALSVHEFAHARVSYAFGDPTAKDAGRLTLNPLRHLDVIGTLLLIFAGFGWAKPVPINPYYYQGDRRKKVMWVSLAGPLSNLAQAIIAAIILPITFQVIDSFGTGIVNANFIQWFIDFIYYYLYINIVLMVFNLLPVPPLDGSKILAGILPARYTGSIYKLEQYGPIILLAMVFFGLTSRIIGPIVDFIVGLLLF